MSHSECKSCSKEPVGTINTARFIDRLDEFLRKNDLNGAKDCITFWEKEAKHLEDKRGLLTVMNEAAGLYRKIGDKENAIKSAETAIELTKEIGLSAGISGATILINAATVYSAFGMPEKALLLYSDAEAVYNRCNRTQTYEYASLLNNKSSAFSELFQYDESEKCCLDAIDILKDIGGHDGEIAVSLINLAHIRYDRNPDDIENIENTLDLAWDHINSPDLKHDENFAFIISKCAPSFDFFQRPEAAEALREVAEEIYAGA